MNIDRFLTIKCILLTDRNNKYLLISDYYRVNAHVYSTLIGKKFHFTGPFIF